MDSDPPEPLISIREFDSIGYTVSWALTTSFRARASSRLKPTHAASGKENTTCGIVSSSTGFGSSPAIFSAMTMPCSKARCAKEWPEVMSPKAHTWSRLVRPNASMPINPRASRSSLQASNQSASVFGMRPMAASTTSP